MTPWSTAVFTLLIVNSLSAGICTGSGSDADAVSTINPERLKLMKDALSWMTFRLNGTLVTDVGIHDYFLQILTNKYRSSKTYHAFVIAFQKGVLPRLTLTENQACDPAYTLKYKNPLNNSVTWHLLWKFAMDSYDNREEDNTHYCDYRQGLVCNEGSRKCQCSPGTKMSVISPHSPVKRCLLEKGEVCSLADLAHGNNNRPAHFLMVLPEMVFNLEKPESCQVGTQCRFIQDNLKLARCYDSNTPKSAWWPAEANYEVGADGKILSWVNPFPGREYDDMEIGDECTLGLWADPGMCNEMNWGHDGKVGSAPGLTCYNFGPPAFQRGPGVITRTGFCAHHYGSYGIASITRSSDWYQPGINLGRLTFTMSFVHRRSVPFNPVELRAYYNRYLKDVCRPLIDYKNRGEDPRLMSIREGQPCNVKATKKMEVIWRYYAALEGTPPPGQDFVADSTPEKLNAKLEETIDLVKGLNDSKICRVYWATQSYRNSFTDPLELTNWVRNDYTFGDTPALKCEPHAGGDKGNDGTCVKSGDASSQAFGEKLTKGTTVASDSFPESKLTRFREKFSREFVLNFCSPEHERCPAGYVCYPDYSDRKIFGSYCEVLVSPEDMNVTCHNMTAEEIKYGRCERETLVRLLEEKMGETRRLKKGQRCDHAFETEMGISSLLQEGKVGKEVNLYKMLASFPPVTGGVFCDPARSVVCSPKNVCTCEVALMSPNRSDECSDSHRGSGWRDVGRAEHVRGSTGLIRGSLIIVLLRGTSTLN